MNPISIAKVEANRANAQFSTGPKTDEGKAASSRNATKNDLFTRFENIPDHLRPEFEQLETELGCRMCPTGMIEEIQFNIIVQRTWQLLRLDKMERALWNESEGLDPLMHPATEKRAATYLRYRRMFESAYQRAFKELERLQTNRAAACIMSNAKLPVAMIADRAKLLKVRITCDREDSRKQLAAAKLAEIEFRMDRDEV